MLVLYFFRNRANEGKGNDYKIICLEHRRAYSRLIGNFEHFFFDLDEWYCQYQRTDICWNIYRSNTLWQCRTRSDISGIVCLSLQSWCYSIFITWVILFTRIPRRVPLVEQELSTRVSFNLYFVVLYFIWWPLWHLQTFLTVLHVQEYCKCSKYSAA